MHLFYRETIPDKFVEIQDDLNTSNIFFDFNVHILKHNSKNIHEINIFGPLVGQGTCLELCLESEHTFLSVAVVPTRSGVGRFHCLHLYKLTYKFIEIEVHFFNGNFDGHIVLCVCRPSLYDLFG